MSGPAAPTGRNAADATAGLASCCTSRPAGLFAFCALLFHFANAPLLPLVGQKLAFAHPIGRRR
jgi:hypothetical protein